MNPDTPYNKLILLRSAVEGRKQGFLPGGQKEKDSPFEEAYPNIFNRIFDRGDAWDVLTKKQTVSFRTTGHLRGLTFDDCIIVVDECQNMNLHELDTIYTRQGVDSRIIFAGDTRQTDLRGPYDVSGMGKFMEILSQTDDMENVTFTPDDILRSPKIKDYILAKERLGY